MSNQDLDNVLTTFNEGACIQFFSKMDEKERKALSERALLWNTVSVGCNLSHPEMQWFAQFMNSAPKRIQKMFTQREEARKLASQLPSAAQKPQAIEVSNIAVFATCGFTEIRKRDAVPKAQAAYKLISDRKPRWTPQFAKYALEKNPSQYWDIVRQMEKQGELKLEHDSTYLAGMALGLDRDGLAEILLDDPQLLEEMWRMLDDHSAMSAMLSQPTDAWNISIGTAGMRWKFAICKLVSEGIIPKDRVLKTVMSTLTRLAVENSDGSVAIRPNWFLEIHKDLDLELDEHLVLFPEYCTILRSRADWALRWAIGQITDVSNVPTFPTDDACVAMAEVFSTKGKENSLLAIECLKKIAKERESMHQSVAMCAAEAMSHTSPDIQKQAIMLIEKYGDKSNIDLVDRLRQQMDYIAVLNRERLAKWLPAEDSIGLDHGTIADGSTVAGDTTRPDGSNSTSNVIQLATASGASSSASDSQTDDLKEQVMSLKESIQDIPESLLKIANLQSGFDAFEGNALDLESIDFDGTEFPRLDDNKKLKPIEDLDELIFLLARHCQGGWGSTDADDLELMMDGISRLGSERPADFEQRTAPIRLINLDPYDVLKMYIEAWLDKKTNMTRFFEYIAPSASTSMYLGGIFGMGSSNPIDQLLSSRSIVAARRISKGISMPMLAAPTHRGGWIDPTVLVQRVFDGAHIPSESLADLEKERQAMQKAMQEAQEQSQNAWQKAQQSMQQAQQSLQQTMLDNIDKFKTIFSGSAGQSMFQALQEHLTSNVNQADSQQASSQSANGSSTQINKPQIKTIDGNVSEQSIALLRLAPERREEALRMLDDSDVKSCEFVDALRYALGAPDVTIGSSAPLWVAAARSRAPFHDDPKIEAKFPGLGPDCGKATRYSLSFTKVEGNIYSYFLPKLLDREPKCAAGERTNIATLAMHYRDAGRFATFYQYIAWSATMWPLCMEPFFAIGAEHMVKNYSTSETSGADKFLTPLYDPDIPAKFVSVVCIAIGLTGKAKDENGAAIEALIQCIEDGRVNGSKLGEVLHQLFTARETERKNHNPIVTLQRWTKALLTVAQASPYHARVVEIALEHLLKGDPSEAPKDLHSALELLLELLMQEQQVLSLPSAREYLSGLKTSGKTQKLTKQLLALKPGPLSRQKLQEAFLYALERRVERVQRWHSRVEQASVLV